MMEEDGEESHDANLHHSSNYKSLIDHLIEDPLEDWWELLGEDFVEKMRLNQTPEYRTNQSNIESIRTCSLNNDNPRDDALRSSIIQPGTSFSDPNRNSYYNSLFQTCNTSL